MGLFAKKKNASGAFSPEQQNFLDAFDGSSDDDDILSPDQRELAKVSVDMTLAGPRLDTPSLELVGLRFGGVGRRRVYL